MKFRQLDNPNRFGSWYHDNLYSLTNTTKKDSFFVTLSDSDTKRTFPWGQKLNIVAMDHARLSKSNSIMLIYVWCPQCGKWVNLLTNTFYVKSIIAINTEL